MGRHLPGPGGEDPHHTERSAKVLGGQGEGLHGARGGRKAPGGPACRVGAGHRASCLRQRKGAEQIRDRQEPRTWCCQPGRRGVMVARGTMPMLAGMIAGLQFPARRARGDMSAQGLGTTVVHRLQSSQGAGQEAVVDLRPGGRAMTWEESGQRDQGSPPKGLRGRPCALPGPRVPCRRLWRSGAWRGPSSWVCCAPKSPE